MTANFLNSTIEKHYLSSSSHLGLVRELASKWNLFCYLEFADVLGMPYQELLDCRVNISKRAKTRAGIAYVRDRRIVLNSALLKPGREKDRDDTFVHECAHVLADLHHGYSCKHGKLWKEMMELLGQRPEIRHNLSYLSRETHAVVIWKCRRCNQKYHFVRRPRRKLNNSYCRYCGPKLGVLKSIPITKDGFD